MWMIFTLMLDGWENAEVDGGCREFGSSGVKGVGRPLVILHTLIVLGYFFLQPHSARGSLGKKSTNWNGREVNRWISWGWELIDVRGNLTKFVVRQPQKEQACTKKLMFLWIVKSLLWFLLLKCICWRSITWPLYVIVDMDLYLRSIFVFSIDLDLCLRSGYVLYAIIFYEIWKNPTCILHWLRFICSLHFIYEWYIWKSPKCISMYEF